MSRRSRPNVAVLVALVVLALIGGCDSGRSLDQTAPVRAGAGGGPAMQPYEVVQGSFDKLVAARTARTRQESFTRVAGRQYTVTGTGNADLQQRGYDLTLDIPMIGSLRAIGLSNNTVYVRSDRLSALLPGRPNWLLLDPARLPPDSPVGGVADNPFIRFALSTGDALPQLALTKGARPADTRAVGPETVEGDPVTHYTTTLDTTLARRYATDPTIVAALDRYAQTVRAQSLPADVWVDAQGRLRRLSITFLTDFSQAATAGTLSFSDLGAPIAPITAPPADQVTDALTLLPRSGG